jgi:hypothetical protein
MGRARSSGVERNYRIPVMPGSAHIQRAAPVVRYAFTPLAVHRAFGFAVATRFDFYDQSISTPNNRQTAVTVNERLEMFNLVQ